MVPGASKADTGDKDSAASAKASEGGDKEEGTVVLVPSSKKDAAVRRRELLAYLREPLREACSANAGELMRSKFAGALVLLEAVRVGSLFSPSCCVRFGSVHFFYFFLVLKKRALPARLDARVRFSGWRVCLLGDGWSGLDGSGQGCVRDMYGFNVGLNPVVHQARPAFPADGADHVMCTCPIVARGLLGWIRCSPVFHFG